MCAITAVIKKYKSIINKKKKIYDIIVLLAKTFKHRSQNFFYVVKRHRSLNF